MASFNHGCCWLVRDRSVLTNGGANFVLIVCMLSARPRGLDEPVPVPLLGESVSSESDLNQSALSNEAY